MLDDSADRWFGDVFPLLANPDVRCDVDDRMEGMQLDGNGNDGSLMSYDGRSGADGRRVVRSKGRWLLESIETLVTPAVFAVGVRDYFRSR